MSVEAPPAPALDPVPFQARRWTSDSVDRLAGSDPGLNRLRSALMSVVTIGAILLAERIFVGLTHALQIRTHGAVLPAAAAAQVATANHEFLVIGLLLGAVVGMISSFGVMDPSARGQLLTMLILPFPMAGALALGLWVGPHRVLALSSLVVMLTVGTYLRRFGPRGFVGGLLLFMGDFFGFFLHGAVALSDMGWLVAEVVLGVAVAILVRFTLFYPRPLKALARTERSYTARAQKVTALALELFDDPGHSERDARRLGRRLVRLNEAALMIDAQLGDASAVADGSSGQLLHQRLFDIELALTNVARFAQALSRLELTDEQRSAVRLALLGVIHGDGDEVVAQSRALTGQLRAGTGPDADARRSVVLMHRFAMSVAALAEAMSDWTALGASPDGDKGTFAPSVMLFGGWLPGSAQVSAVASMETGRGLWGRVALKPWTRTAIQMGVAVGAAIALGDVLSGRRFYWAVIAAFITFMGANNSGEQIRKAVFRVLGTVVGIAVGSGVVHLVGHHTYVSIAVILVALFFAFYLMRINYAFMVIGITVMVSQLYVQLDEFTNSLLVLRLEETALGAGVTILVVMLVLPLRTRRVLRVAIRAHVEALGALTDNATARLTGDGRDLQTTLRADARAIDASYQAVVATIAPLRGTLSGELDETVGAAVRVASASRHYGRNLVTDVETVGPLDAETRHDIALGGDTLHASLAVVGAALNGPRDGTYTRSSALFDRAEQRLEEHAGLIGKGQFALRDLTLIDGAIASLAELMHLHVTDYDTAPAAATS